LDFPFAMRPQAGRTKCSRRTRPSQSRHATATDATVEIALTNDLREIATVAALIDSFCAERGIAHEVAYAVNLALEELLNNIIAYGYDDEEPHRIEVLLRREGEVLVVIVVDDGKTFDPTRSPALPPCWTTTKGWAGSACFSSTG